MHSSLGNLSLKVVVPGKNALLTPYWLATFFSLNFDFDLFVSTESTCHQIFEESFLNCFLLTSTVYFSYSVFFRIFSVIVRDLILGFLVGEIKRGRYGGSNLGANYDSANNSQKKGVSWYRCSSKIDKIPEKYIWRSSSSVNEYVESLQRVTLFKL